MTPQDFMDQVKDLPPETRAVALLVRALLTPIL